MTDKLECWHFANNDLRLGYDDGREIVAGESLRVEGAPVLCETGLHGSIRLLDALQYAPGHMLCRVELSDGIIEGDDKAVSRERKTLWIFNAENALRDFAATVAENALLAERAAGREPDPRSWFAVQFVRDLLAGKIKPEDQEAAWSAARSAAWSAARSAARSAAWSAAWSAARSAWSAVESAAWSAAWSALSAAESAARSAAWSAAWSAARSAQNDLLADILKKWGAPL